METVAVVLNKPLDRQLSVDECYINGLTFLDEIAACERKRGASGVVGANYLRAIAEETGRRYDKTFNPYRHVVPSDYHGTPSNSPEETAAIVKEMFNARYPQIFYKYIETKFKSRPHGAKVIYFVGPQDEAYAFEKLGVKIVSEKEANSYTGAAQEANSVDCDSSLIVPEQAMQEYLELVNQEDAPKPVENENLLMLNYLTEDSNSGTQVETVNNSDLGGKVLEHFGNSENQQSENTQKVNTAKIKVSNRAK